MNRYVSTGIDAELEGLARSLGSKSEPRLAEPPVVEEMPDGSYRLCAGERRVEAARLAGWTSILCLVYPPMDPARAHTLGLVENMHRLPMHPLEEISALCISRLLANADARGSAQKRGDYYRMAGSREYPATASSRAWSKYSRDSGWVRERPDVTWKAHLDDLGISMAPWERKRKLRLLNIEPALQERLRELDITEAALRSLGTLEPDDQKRVVEALLVNPPWRAKCGEWQGRAATGSTRASRMLSRKCRVYRVMVCRVTELVAFRASRLFCLLLIPPLLPLRLSPVLQLSPWLTIPPFAAYLPSENPIAKSPRQRRAIAIFERARSHTSVAVSNVSTAGLGIRLVVMLVV